MRTRLMKGLEIPFAIDGKATLMVKNLLAAVLGTVISDVNPYVVKIALESFIPSPELTSGRMNILPFTQFSIMIYDGHNPGGLTQLSLKTPCNLCSSGIQILKYNASGSLKSIGFRKRYRPILFSVPR
jgi:hypothetical protein